MAVVSVVKLSELEEAFRLDAEFLSLTKINLKENS